MKGDFLGFTFDGVHSSRLGITRVSEGDRYNESLLPEFEDRIVQVPGRDGAYYFGSDYSSKPISISIAYDSMTESQFRQLGKLFGTKHMGQLIFDERPYKVYTVKVSVPPQLSYICFDEPKKELTEAREGVRVINREEVTHTYIDEETGEEVTTTETVIERERVTPYKYTGARERIYKGEGTIEFVTVQPFAKEQFKVLDQYGEFDFWDQWGQHFQKNPDISYGNSLTTYTNVNEWGLASGLLSYDFYTQNNIDRVVATTDVTGYNAVIPLYNPGDRDTPYYLFLPYTEVALDSKGTLDAPDGAQTIALNQNNSIMIIEPFESKTTYKKENGIIINTHNHLIEGVLYDKATSSWRTTGNLYNGHILAGDFSKIKAHDWSMDSTQYSQQLYLNCATAMGAKIHYNYLYY